MSVQPPVSPVQDPNSPETAHARLAPDSGTGNRSRLAWIVFWSGFTLFVAARIASVAIPALARAEPVEIDDAYRYLAQAQVMEKCFDRDCPALRSIALQLPAPTADTEVAFHRLRTDIHLFTYFHPLYSLALTGLREMGLSAPQAYGLASLALGLMLVVAIGVWLLAIFGPAPAGIALGLLAFYALPGHGLHFVPGTFAWGFAAFSWAAILRRKSRLYVLVPVLWLGALATHPMGVFYVGAALLMLLGMSLPRLDRASLRLLVVGALLVMGRIVLAAVVPSFGLSGDIQSYYPRVTGTVEALTEGLRDLEDWIGRWGATYWRLGGAALLVVVGVAVADTSSRRRVWVTGVALFVVLIVSLLYYHPVHGSTATGRIWACLAVFLTGAIAYAIAYWLRAGAAWIRGVRQGGAKAESLSLKGAAVLLLGVLLLRSMATNLRYSVKAYREGMTRMMAKDNLELGGETTFAPILALRADQGAVYLDEISLYAGLAQGTFGRDAAYLPILGLEELGPEGLKDAERFVYAVGESPISQLPFLDRGGIALPSGVPLEVLGPASLALPWKAVRLENTGDEATLEIRVTDPANPRSEMLEVPAGFAGWLPLPTWLEGRAGFSLMAETDGAKVSVKGLQSDEKQESYWPWDRGVRLRVADPERAGPIVVTLSLSSLSDKLGLPLEILSDGHSLLLARIGD